MAPSPPQISTRETDYLVDVLKARDSVWLLNEVFTDPVIMKVLHGADMDVVWPVSYTHLTLPTSQQV